MMHILRTIPLRVYSLREQTVLLSSAASMCAELTPIADLTDNLTIASAFTFSAVACAAVSRRRQVKLLIRLYCAGEIVE